MNLTEDTKAPETCGHRTSFGEWVCDAPAGHAQGQHYFIKAAA